MLGITEGKRRRGQQRMRWLDGIADSEHELEQTPEDSEAQETWHAAIHGVKRAGHN